MLPVVIQVLLRKKSKRNDEPTTLMSDDKLERMGRRWVASILAIGLFFGLGYLYTRFAV